MNVNKKIKRVFGKHLIGAGLTCVFMLMFPLKAVSFSFFDSDQTRNALTAASIWSIENAIDIHSKLGKDVAKARLMSTLPSDIQERAKPKLSMLSFYWSPEQMSGGWFSVVSLPEYVTVAHLIYRAELDGEIYEYWRIETNEKSLIGEDYLYLNFALSKKDNNSEKRQVLHYEDHFFVNYELAPGKVFQFPIEEARLISALETNRPKHRKYFQGTALENIKTKLINGDLTIVEYNFEDQERKRQLRSARKEVKRLDSLAWWLPKEGMPLYREEGTAGLSKQLEKAYLETDIEVNESAWKSGVGKVFTLEVENKNTHYDVYLISRIKKDGETYEYWLLDGRAIDKSLDIHYRSYVFAKVAAETEERKHLEKSANPITSYTTKSGSVINLPDVDSILGIK